MMIGSVRVCFYLSALLLVVAPFYYAGKTASGLLLIECIGLSLVFCIIWGGLYSDKLFGVLWVYLFVSVGLALVYLLPVPMDIWRELPGRSLYAESFDWLKQNGTVVERFPLSIVPSKTILSLLMLIPTLGIFLSAVSLPSQQIKHLIYVLLLVATLQALLGLIQYASNSPSFIFGMKYSGSYAQGMYVNRNHFVALMEMVLPLALGLMLYSVGRSGSDSRSKDSRFQISQFLLFAFAVLVIFLGAIFSKSRTGIFLTLLMFLLSSVVFSRHVGGKKSASWMSAILVIAGGLAVTIGLAPILNRIILSDPFGDGRWPIFRTSISVIREFFPFGSGPGTYAEAYRAFQPVEQAFFANHAHNDYLELLVEMGSAGGLIIFGFLILYIYGWVRLRRYVWNRMKFLQIASGLAILAILIHSFLDFNLHTPANFVVFAFLSGVFFRKNILHK